MLTVRVPVATILTLLTLAGAIASCGRAEQRAHDLYDQAAQQAQAGDLDAALATAQQAIGIAPNSHWSWWALARVRLERDEYAGAEEAYRKAISLAPDEPELHFGLATSLADQGKWTEATSEFRSVLSLDPQRNDAREGLLGSLVQLGDWDRAITEARAMLKTDPSSGVAHDVLGYSLAAGGQAEEGIAELREAVRLMPNAAQVHAHLAEVLQRHGDLDEAQEEARRAIDLDGMASPHRTLGRVLFKRKQYEEAVDQFRTALAIDPDDAGLHRDLSFPLMALGRTGEAVTELRHAIELEPGDASSMEYLASALQRAGLLQDELVQQQAKVAANPDDPDARMLLGYLYYQEEDVPAGAEEFRQAVDLRPDNPRRIAAATNLLLQIGEAGECVGLLRSIADRVPEDQRLWLKAGLARALAYTGETAEARALLDELAPQVRTPREHLALAQGWSHLTEWEKTLGEVQTAREAPGAQEVQSPAEPLALAFSGRLSEAEDVARRGVSSGIDPSQARAVLAWVLARQDEDQEAREQLEAVAKEIAWEYTPLEVLFPAGLAYRELGDTEKSDALFQRCIDRWPRHPWCQKMREMME